MFGNDKRNGRTASTAITTLIAEGTTIRGDVRFSGGLHLDGAIEGAVDGEGSDAVLTLSDKGRISGEIRAPHVIVNGTVKGDIVAGERLELAAQARVEGNVYYKVLEMAAGAQVNGKILYQEQPPRQLAKPEVDKREIEIVAA